MKIREIGLITNDVIGTKEFYAGVLQFSVVREQEGRVSFQAGESVLTFIEDRQVVNPIYHFAFNIPHNQLSAAADWLTGKAALLPVTADTYVAEFSNWNANAIYFTDNNGNLLEFIARHDLKNDSEVTFGAGSIACISEIGIAVDSVPAYIASQAVPVFAKQQPMPQFAALGDDHGLLVVAEKGRNWYPTTIAAAEYPLELSIQQ